MPIRLVLADDHPVFRSGLRALLERERDLVVVAEADDGDAAMAAILHHRPDVALLDLDMPKRDAFAIVEAIAISVPETAIGSPSGRAAVPDSVSPSFLSARMAWMFSRASAWSPRSIRMAALSA